MCQLLAWLCFWFTNCWIYQMHRLDGDGLNVSSSERQLASSWSVCQIMRRGEEWKLGLCHCLHYHKYFNWKVICGIDWRSRWPQTNFASPIGLQVKANGKQLKKQLKVCQHIIYCIRTWLHNWWWFCYFKMWSKVLTKDFVWSILVWFHIAF